MIIITIINIIIIIIIMIINNNDYRYHIHNMLCTYIHNMNRNTVFINILSIIMMRKQSNVKIKRNFKDLGEWQWILHVYEI